MLASGLASCLPRLTVCLILLTTFLLLLLLLLFLPVLDLLLEVLEEVAVHFFERMSSKQEKVISFIRKLNLVLLLGRIVLPHFVVVVDQLFLERMSLLLTLKVVAHIRPLSLRLQPLDKVEVFSRVVP